jgi:HK97 family phage major capsid protein
MAEININSWIPVEYSPDVIQKVKQMSAVAANAQPVTMKSESRSTPRSGGVTLAGIPKGGTYGEDSTGNDAVWLYAQKLGGAVRLAEEDQSDSLADVVNTKSVDAATAFAKLLDNSCLGVTTAKGSYSPAFQYDSLYYVLTQTDPVTGYQANANINQTASGSGAPTYKDLSKALGIVEQGDYYDESGLVVMAHPKLKQLLREIVDLQGRPIFNESSNGTAGGGQGGGPTLFGHKLQWSLGARTSAAPTQNPTGNPLVVFASANYLMLGNRSPLEVQYIDPNGVGALTDDAILKFRARKAFAVGHQNATSILEVRP